MDGRYRGGATPTAIGRGRPVVLALNDGLLCAETTFFDYGCRRAEISSERRCRSYAGTLDCAARETYWAAFFRPARRFALVHRAKGSGACAASCYCSLAVLALTRQCCRGLGLDL